MLDQHTRATLDSEDKVLKTYATIKSRYNRMLTEIKKAFYTWIAEYDIHDVISAQRYWKKFESQLNELISDENAARMRDVKQLMIDIYTFNYLFTLQEYQWVQDDTDNENLTAPAILALLGVAWAGDNMNFEQRMLKRKRQLIMEVHKVLVQQIAIGTVDNKTLWKAVDDIIGKTIYRGSVPIANEAQYIVNEAVRKAAERRCDGYTVSEVLDYRTCKFCKSVHGKHFTWDEYSIGATAPLFHPRCRGRIIPDRKI